MLSFTNTLVLDISQTRFQISEYFSNRFALKLSKRVAHYKHTMKHSLSFLPSGQWKLTLGLYSHMQWCAQMLGKACCFFTRKQKVKSNTTVRKTRHKLSFESIALFISGIHLHSQSVSVGDTWTLLPILTSQFKKSAFALNQQGHRLSPTKSLPISTSQ